MYSLISVKIKSSYNCFNLFFQSVSKKYQNIVFLLIFRTRYVRWILLIHLTPPYGLILPGLAPGLPYKLGNRCLPALAGAMPPSPKQARASKLPQALRVACSNGGNLAFPPARPPPSIVPPDIFGQSSIHLSIQTRAAAKASSRLTIGSSSIF